MASISTTRCRSRHPPSHTPPSRICTTTAWPRAWSQHKQPVATGRCPAAGVRRPGPAARHAVGVQAGGPAAGDARPDIAARQADLPGRRHRLPVRSPAHDPASIVAVPLQQVDFGRGPVMRPDPGMQRCRARLVRPSVRAASMGALHRWQGRRRDACSVPAAMTASITAPQAELVLAGVEPQHLLPRVQH